MNFYRFNRGAQFEEKFTALERVIKYLYHCLHSAITQDVRENARLSASIDDELLEKPSEERIETSLDALETWKRIQMLLPEAEYQRLAYLRFVLGMKPAEIIKIQPEVWADTRDVSVALQSIRRRLRDDPWLRGQAGI